MRTRKTYARKRAPFVPLSVSVAHCALLKRDIRTHYEDLLKDLEPFSPSG